jgi:nitroreductase
MTADTCPDFLSALRRRYATKQFNATRPIPANVWQALEESLVLTPSSFGLQPWKFIVVENPDLRQQLREVSWNQSQVTDASHFVVLTARDGLDQTDIDRWIRRMTTVQGGKPADASPLRSMIEGFVSSMTPGQRHAWNVKQVYIALGQLMTVAAIAGVDSCPMEGIDPAAYDRILGLIGSGYATAVACALGYRSGDDKYASMPKARFAHEEVVVRA